MLIYISIIITYLRVIPFLFFIFFKILTYTISNCYFNFNFYIIFNLIPFSSLSLLFLLYKSFIHFSLTFSFHFVSFPFHLFSNFYFNFLLDDRRSGCPFKYFNYIRSFFFFMCGIRKNSRNYFR